jgi:serine-type D-Ala-D-Ala carboxypeptidase
LLFSPVFSILINSQAEITADSLKLVPPEGVENDESSGFTWWINTMKNNLIILAAAGICTACIISASMCTAEKTGELIQPEKAGMSSVHLARISPALDKAVKNREFPGAVLLVGRSNQIVYRRAFGHSRWEPQPAEMKTGMIFDLSSLTKPLATATAIMILVERGQIRLWDKVEDFIPGFKPFIDEAGGPAENARIWHLLTHTSGLPGYIEQENADIDFGAFCATPALVGYIAALPKESPPGENFIYSCLGYITLAQIIEDISGKNLSEFTQEFIFQPLGMKHTFFLPPADVRTRCVPTQRLDDNEVLQGIVHDPLARLQGGISGNAGLFSTADDLALFAQMLLNQGEIDGVRILSPLTVRRMTEIYPWADSSGRGLGWDLDSPYSTNGGDLFGARSYGHTGYTGTSIWIDPETETYVILLTNRVHPDDQGDVITLRSRIANIVAASIMQMD